jgi:acylphosphatase
MIRRTSYFSGRVQGVGFRYTARSIARGFDVKGYVRNLPDRRVEVVAEGQADEIDRFLAEIGQKMEGFIKNRTDDDSPATGEFSDFGVRH